MTYGVDEFTIDDSSSYQEDFDSYLILPVPGFAVPGGIIDEDEEIYRDFRA